MSRWYMTPSEKAHQQAENVCKRAGLTSSGYISHGGLHVQTYRKRAIDTQNFIECGNGNWLCSAGTIIYNARLGATALHDFYSDFIGGGIEAVRSRAIGHYSVAIRRENNVTIFTDPHGALTLYYADAGPWWIVSNSLQICAQALPARNIDPIKLAITAIQSYTPGEETFYSGVRRLFGTQAIDIDIEERSFRVGNVSNTVSPGLRAYSSISETLEQYKLEVQSVFRELVAVGSVGLLGTGGLDSRTVLSALLDQEVSPQMMYGVGDCSLTDDHPRDLEIAKNIAKSFDLHFQQLDWSGDQPHPQETMQELFERYGFQYEIHGAPQGLLQGFSGDISPYPTLFLGGRGPAFTNRKPWELRQTQFSFDDLVEYAISTDVKGGGFICGTEYKGKFSQEVRTGLRCGQIDYPDEGVSLKKFVKAYTSLHLLMDVRFLNFANEFCHYVTPFAMKRLHDPLVDMPYEYRANDEFQIRLIHALAPELIDPPLFSGHQHSRIDRETFVIKRVEEEQSVLGRLADLFIPSQYRDTARQMYLRTRYGKGAEDGKLRDKDSRIIQAYGQEVIGDPLAAQCLSSTAGLHIKSLERFYHYLVGVNALGYYK